MYFLFAEHGEDWELIAESSNLDYIQNLEDQLNERGIIASHIGW